MPQLQYLQWILFWGHTVPVFIFICQFLKCCTSKQNDLTTTTFRSQIEL